MKKMALICVFTLIAIFTWSSACLAEETKPAEESYPSLVQGLRKFNPVRYKNYTVATYHGFSRYPCKDEKGNSIGDCEMVELRLVTIDGEYMSLKIRLNTADMALFLHEISPRFGKYRSWDPVIEIYLKLDKFDPGYTSIHALRLVGRFQTNWDRDKNEIKNYKEERYY